MNRGFGRIQSPFDSRDYMLRDYMYGGKTYIGALLNEKQWEFPGLSLDQGETNHCVGFTMANFGINCPINTKYTNDDGSDFYYMCKIIDKEPLKEDGSYIRSAAKVLKNLGKIDIYAFASNIEDIKYWIINKSPILAGTMWTEGMMTPDANNFLTISGEVVGGHAYLLNEWTSNDYIGIQNSWGENWGKNGKAYISAADFQKLFLSGGEALATVELLDKHNEPERPDIPVEEPIIIIPIEKSDGLLPILIKILCAKCREKETNNWLTSLFMKMFCDKQD